MHHFTGSAIVHCMGQNVHILYRYLYLPPDWLCSPAVNCSWIRKISGKKSWIILSRSFDRDHFLTLNTASVLFYKRDTHASSLTNVMTTFQNRLCFPFFARNIFVQFLLVLLLLSQNLLWFSPFNSPWPSRGWGGQGKYPHPRQVQSCHITTHIITHMPFFSKNPDLWRPPTRQPVPGKSANSCIVNPLT